MDAPTGAKPDKPVERDETEKLNNSLALTVRRLRREASLTLNELAQRCVVAPSTLSKIENGQMSPTYDTILRLAGGLRVDIAELFTGKTSVPASGRRTITRKDQGAALDTEHYTYEMLCADIANKQFVPLLSRIKASSIKDFSSLFSHPGEEFVYVLSGSITLHTEFYAPALLKSGDSCYFDSPMGHALVSTSEEPATILWICSRVVQPLAS